MLTDESMSNVTVKTCVKMQQHIGEKIVMSLHSEFCLFTVVHHDLTRLDFQNTEKQPKSSKLMLGFCSLHSADETISRIMIVLVIGESISGTQEINEAWFSNLIAKHRLMRRL